MDNLPSKIKWNAPEYEFHEKSTEWYWALGIITAASSWRPLFYIIFYSLFLPFWPDFPSGFTEPEGRE